ncbi:MAG: sigma-70 family RNA polymerase sigma factor [Chloroflexota bacterium]|nr:sigma-70 family RNA polymerase sigma factor [Chloroflexota bacterium]
MDSIFVLESAEGRELADGDAALVRAARDEPAAFGSLYERYRHRVYAYLRARVSNEQDAADLTQQVFLRAFRGLPRYRGDGSGFAAWLFRIAHNAAADLLRARRHSVPWDSLPEALQPPADGSPEVEVLRREAVRLGRKLVAGLDEDKRELLALHFGANLATPADLMVRTASIALPFATI